MPTRCLLGQLELGLGAGFIRACEAPAGHVRELVLGCVDRDLRTSPLDSRADYYALLLLATGADPSAVERLVAAHEPRTGDWLDGSELPLDVLIRMGVRGDRRAQDALITYMADGIRWPHIVSELLEDVAGRMLNIPSWRATVEELGTVLCLRFPTVPQLLTAMEELGFLWAGDPASPPWSLWAPQHRVIAEALQRALEAEENDGGALTGAEYEALLAPLSTKALLALERLDPFVTRVLEQRTSVSDVRRMIVAASDESHPMQGPALLALASQQRPEAFGLVAELSDEMAPPSRQSRFRALSLLPYEQTHSLVREWFASDQESRRWAAAEALAKHASAADIPMIRADLCRDEFDRDAGNPFIVCALMAALRRHPVQGPFGELISIFHNLPWSYVREDVARTMAATDPSFGQTHAVECLWDCEPEVRALGAAHVHLDAPGVRARLQAIAVDWAEVAETQDAARSRLRC